MPMPTFPPVLKPLPASGMEGEVAAAGIVLEPMLVAKEPVVLVMGALLEAIVLAVLVAEELLEATVLVVRVVERVSGLLGSEMLKFWLTAAGAVAPS